MDKRATSVDVLHGEIAAEPVVVESAPCWVLIGLGSEGLRTHAEVRAAASPKRVRRLPRHAGDLACL